MMSLLDLFFACLNFGIIAAVIIYVMRSHVTPFIKERIMKAHEDFMHLHREHRRLLHEQEELELSIVSQEELAKNLFKKINQWRNMVEVASQAKMHESKLLKEAADQKVVEQARRYELYRTYVDIAPLVITQLEEMVHKRFSDSKEGHRYLSSVLSTLTKHR